MESTADLDDPPDLVVWRLDQKKFERTMFSGHGSARFPGRWNLHGQPVVYCSSSVSLATLEILVGMSPSILSKMKYVVASVKIPKSVVVSMKALTEKDAAKIHPNWRDTPPPEDVQVYGGDWHIKKDSAILRVPSAVIPQEYNYVLHTYHPDFQELIFGKPEPFEFDPRLLLNTA